MLNLALTIALILTNPNPNPAMLEATVYPRQTYGRSDGRRARSRLAKRRLNACTGVNK